MKPEEINAIVTLLRRAPLQNMQEAEGAAYLIQKLQAHFAKVPGDAPEVADGAPA